jgi:sRNA-binding regulator protein Hfq
MMSIHEVRISKLNPKEVITLSHNTKKNVYLVYSVKLKGQVKLIDTFKGSKRYDKVFKAFPSL